MMQWLEQECHLLTTVHSTSWALQKVGEVISAIYGRVGLLKVHGIHQCLNFKPRKFGRTKEFKPLMQIQNGANQHC